ncbi:MAG: lycopene cyclase domain-containing protein [Flavobacteriales bacterium]
MPLYLIVNILVLLPPLLLSFDKKVHFASRWRAHFPVNLTVMAGFILWDVAFTDMGIWGFNPVYLIGYSLFGLPLEEWLFFITIPYACSFTYVTLQAYIRRNLLADMAGAITFICWLICIGLVVHHPGHLYIQWAAGLSALALTWALIYIPAWLGRFWMAYFVLLLPFVISNGVLTGISFWEYPFLHHHAEAISDQIVWYDPNHNTGWRIFSMPADDLVYGFLLIFLNIAGMEALQVRQSYQRKVAAIGR